MLFVTLYVLTIVVINFAIYSIVRLELKTTFIILKTIDENVFLDVNQTRTVFRWLEL